MTLRVRSLDRAFNPSPATSYTFLVSSTAPTITPAVPSPASGEPTTFTLRPDATLQSKNPVVSYSVHMVGVGGPDGDKTVDVPAAADGTATAELTPDGIYGEQLLVTGKSANGVASRAESASSVPVTRSTTKAQVSDPGLVPSSVITRRVPGSRQQACRAPSWLRRPEPSGRWRRGRRRPLLPLLVRVLMDQRRSLGRVPRISGTSAGPGWGLRRRLRSQEPEPSRGIRVQLRTCGLCGWTVTFT